MRKQLPIFVLILTLFTPFSVFSENIRGDVVKHFILSDNSPSTRQEFNLGIEDVFAVSFDRNSEFIKGVEIEVKVPGSLRSYSNSFAFNIYSRISPEITSGIGTYYGNKYHSLILPEAARFFIRIPYSQLLEGENEPYTTVLSKKTEYRDSPLMFTVLPMMKGFPSSLYNSNFTLNVTPILKDSGILNLSISLPEGLNRNELIISIDGKQQGNENNIKLVSGSHKLNLEIPGGRSLNRSFTINRGETTNLQLEIVKLESWASIDVPENTLVYIDSEKIEIPAEGRILMSPGEHTVLLKIGDYKISKKFDIQAGKDYKISLFLDIFVEEN